MIKGVQSIAFKEQPYIIESASVVGKKEGEGPLGAMFDVIEEENLFGEDTWEAAESTMQKRSMYAGAWKGTYETGRYSVSLRRRPAQTGSGNFHGSGRIKDSDVRALRCLFYVRRGFGIGFHGGGSRIWRSNAGSYLQSFRKRRKGISFPT